MSSKFPRAFTGPIPRTLINEYGFYPLGSSDKIYPGHMLECGLRFVGINPFDRCLVAAPHHYDLTRRSLTREWQGASGWSAFECPICTDNENNGLPLDPDCVICGGELIVEPVILGE